MINYESERIFEQLRVELEVETSGKTLPRITKAPVQRAGSLLEEAGERESTPRDGTRARQGQARGGDITPIAYRNSGGPAGHSE